MQMKYYYFHVLFPFQILSSNYTLHLRLEIYRTAITGQTLDFLEHPNTLALVSTFLGAVYLDGCVVAVPAKGSPHSGRYVSRGRLGDILRGAGLGNQRR